MSTATLERETVSEVMAEEAPTTAARPGGGLRVTLPRKVLHEGLQMVTRAISQSTSLPVLRTVLIEARAGGTLHLSGTDLELACEVRLPATVAETGSICAPASTLAAMVAGLPEADVLLSSENEGRLRLECRKVGTNLNGESGDNFPSLPEVLGKTQFTLSQQALKQALKQALVAVSDDDTRPILTGVLFTISDLEPDVLRVVATNTHILAVKRVKLPEPAQACAHIIPSRVLAELAKGLTDEGEIRLRFDENQVEFRAEGWVLTSRVIAGLFPKYERVVPASYTRRLTMQVDELRSALRRARIISRSNETMEADRVIFEVGAANLLGEQLVIETDGSAGKHREEVEIAREGEAVTLAIDAEYVLGVLGVIESEGVHLEMTEPLSPVVFKPVGGADYLCVVMPMQVQ